MPPSRLVAPLLCRARNSSSVPLCPTDSGVCPVFSLFPKMRLEASLPAPILPTSLPRFDLHPFPHVCPALPGFLRVTAPRLVPFRSLRTPGGEASRSPKGALRISASPVFPLFVICHSWPSAPVGKVRAMRAGRSWRTLRPRKVSTPACSNFSRKNAFRAKAGIPCVLFLLTPPG